MPDLLHAIRTHNCEASLFLLHRTSTIVSPKHVDVLMEENQFSENPNIQTEIKSLHRIKETLSDFSELPLDQREQLSPNHKFQSTLQNAIPEMQRHFRRILHYLALENLENPKPS